MLKTYCTEWFSTRTWVKTGRVYERRMNLSEILRFAQDDRLTRTMLSYRGSPKLTLAFLGW
jgi:hypothetical protein